MPHDEGLPQSGDSQEIGQEAYDCLRAKRPKGWQITELGGVNDFGFDLQVQISVKHQTLHPIRVQLKGTRSPQLSADGTFLSINLYTSTLRYFDNTDEPVLLVLCDLSVDPEDPREGNIYYVWIREELDRIQIGSIPQNQEKAAIRVPTANVLDRSTDLFETVRKLHRLSRVGHALDTSVAGLDPSLGSDERVVMLEAISKNIGTRNIVFAQALAEPATEVWLNPPRGSLAWLLIEAKTALASGKVDRCEDLLRQAYERQDNFTSLERAEYWHITGRTRLVRGDDEGASNAFKSAADAQPLAKYWAAWAESEMRRRFKADSGGDYSDVSSALPADSDPVLLGVKARLLATSRKHAEAIVLLDTFDGAESLAARAVVQTMYSKSDEALQACIDGLALEEKNESSRLLFLILRARARFNIAMKGAAAPDASGSKTENDILPPSGPIGVDASELRRAWVDIEEAVAALEDIRWISNAEFVIDLWIATASMLGKQDQILPRVLSAARQRPHQADLQTAAEALAAQCGEFEAALEANSRLPDSTMKILRRASILHELGKHRDCVELMTAHVDTLSREHQLFGSVLVLAALSADVMARADLVGSWRAILAGGDLESQAHAATLDYLIARPKNQLQSSEPLAELLRIDEQLGHPTPTTLRLFQELDAGSPTEAEQFLIVATRLRTRIRLAPMIAARIGVALATLGRWHQLLALCEEADREFEVTGRIKAFRALALDQLGRSGEATAILDDMLEGGMDDGLALNTYVNIMVRWGFTEKAQSAAELILERAQTRERRLECVRMLFNLEQHANPTSPRLVDLAFRMGELVTRDDEAEEGVFLCMVIAATSFETTPLSEQRKEELQSRANIFFAKFPQSKIIRMVEIPTDAGAEELLRSMKSVVGLSEEREQHRAQLETQLQTGELHLPFAWRPRFALGNVQDVAHLWELAKRSARDEKKFHLTMIGQEWEQRPAASFQSRTPLFDLITLFVLKDLELLDKVFDFFPKIAISQQTLSELMKMSQGFSGSIFRERCMELQESLRLRISQIRQPRAATNDEDDHLPPSAREIQNLVDSGDYILYSDDVVLRMWTLREKFSVDGMCSLDLLCGLEQVGLLTTEEVATKLAQLCDWHVGIQIQLRHQLALIPPEVHAARDLADAASMLRGAEKFMSMADAMWGPLTDLVGACHHIGAVVRTLAQDPTMSDVTIGAFAIVWIDHALARPHMSMSMPALQLAAQIPMYAVAVEKLPIAPASRLWNIYFGVVDFFHGSVDSNAYNVALARVAQQAAALDKRIKSVDSTNPTNFGERLMMGLGPNSNAWVAFSTSYVQALE